MFSTTPAKIYFDYHATTPVDPRVAKKMWPYFTEIFGNAGSSHCFGLVPQKACKTSRKQLAALFGAGKDSEVIFTSGATESNNLAIKGIGMARRNIGRHIITSAVEHWSIIAACKYMESEGFDVSYLEPDSHGKIDPEQIQQAIRKGAKGTAERTILISIMGANNEIGTINDVAQIGKIAHENDVVFHVDGAQSVGKIPFVAKDLNVDLVSMSGHKIYGPKGVGALYIRDDVIKRHGLQVQIHGGGQEAGLRAGTQPVPLLVGLGEAAELAQLEMAKDCAHLLSMRLLLIAELQSKGIPFRLNGHPDDRLSGNAHLTFEGIDGEFLQIAFRNIAVSSTSACSANKNQPSHVLTAIGLTSEQAGRSVRFGFGRFNVEQEVHQAVAEILEVYRKYGSAEVQKKMRKHSHATVLNHDLTP
jgi:cysteine desulfurase